MKLYHSIPILFILLFGISACKHQARLGQAEEIPDSLTININGKGLQLEIVFKKGEKHNHPTFAFWIEDPEGNYIQTLFVTQYIATGVYAHGDAGKGEWKRDKGPAERPAALPYWVHKRNVKNPDGSLLPNADHPVPDAYTGATPQNSFRLSAKTDKKIQGKFRLLMEINQPWDWNDYWTTAKYPNDPPYNPSAQPSLVYAVTIDPDCSDCEFFLNPIGHGHYAGKDGRLYTDLRNFTTAFDIVESVQLKSLK